MFECGIIVVSSVKTLMYGFDQLLITIDMDLRQQRPIAHTGVSIGLCVI